MSKLRVFFVEGVITSVVDDTIAVFSKGKYVHTAVEILGGTLESKGEIDKDSDGNDIPPGVRLSPIGIYDGREDVLIKVVDVPNLAAAEETARNLIGVPYGYIDCAEGGIHDQTGIVLPDDGTLTADCSKTVALVLRAGEVTIDGDIPAGNITPMDLVNELGGE